MIQRLAEPRVQPSTLRIWGLSPSQIFDAYWRSRGVQCVRRGEGLIGAPGVELYLLHEPGQLGLFDLASVLRDVTWSGAPLHRVRIVETCGEHYRERVLTDEGGRIRRIERRYRSHPVGGLRVLLTGSEKLARTWAEAPTHRDGWTQLRGSVAWSRRNHHRVEGWCYAEEDPAESADLLLRLVRTWPDPGGTIEGLEQLEPGVWAPAGTRLPGGSTVVGPVWLGRHAADHIGEPLVLIGPDFLEDAATTSAVDCEPARVRDMVEIVPPETRVRAVRARRHDLSYRVAKRFVDVVVSAVVLAITLPIILLIALAVWLDDGRPIFFGHLRQTLGGRHFRCWKFRTMRRDADQLTRQLATLNACDGPQFFIRNDPRVTTVGRFLRRWHLDELPQFLNVLKGDMSLVGPRPSPDGENQYCPAWREIRLSVRPGITGLWQVRRTRAPGRDFQEWIRYDIEYVQSAGLLFDLRICVDTLRAIVGAKRVHVREAPFEKEGDASSLASAPTPRGVTPTE